MIGRYILVGIYLTKAAPPKNKRIIFRRSLAINRPPLRGFKPSRAVAGIWGGPRFALVSLKKPPRRCGNDKGWKPALRRTAESLSVALRRNRRQSLPETRA